MSRRGAPTSSPSSIPTARSLMASCRTRSQRFAQCACARSASRQEERVALLLHDTVDFPVAFWGTMRAGCVAIPLNTFLTVPTIRLYPRRLARHRADRRRAAGAGDLADPRRAAASAHHHPGRRHRRRQGELSRPRRASVRGRDRRRQRRRRSPPTRCPTRWRSGSTPRARPAIPRASSTSIPT